MAIIINNGIDYTEYCIAHCTLRLVRDIAVLDVHLLGDPKRAGVTTQQHTYLCDHISRIGYRQYRGQETSRIRLYLNRDVPNSVTYLEFPDTVTYAGDKKAYEGLQSLLHWYRRTTFSE